MRLKARFMVQLPRVCIVFHDRVIARGANARAISSLIARNRECCFLGLCARLIKRATTRWTTRSLNARDTRRLTAFNHEFVNLNPDGCQCLRRKLSNAICQWLRNFLFSSFASFPWDLLKFTYIPQKFVSYTLDNVSFLISVASLSHRERERERLSFCLLDIGVLWRWRITLLAKIASGTPNRSSLSVENASMIRRRCRRRNTG